MNHLLNDESRFVALLGLLTEKFVDEFANYYLHNGYYPVEYSNIIDEYNSKKDEILFAFSNTKINDAAIELNNTFGVLRSFLIQHFSIPAIHRGVNQDPPFYYLKPEIHHNFREYGDTKAIDATRDSKKWDELKKELEIITEGFESAFKNFVTVAANELENEKKIQLKWWEKTWVQLVISISLTIIGIITSNL